MVGSRLIAKSTGIGIIELSDQKVMVEQAQKIGEKKLAQFKEQRHQATSFLLKTLKGKN